LLSIETSTAVESIQVDVSSLDFPYLVQTSRGTIQASHVVHATNAFATNLVPGLRGKATGARVQMTSQRPGLHFPNLNGQRSWSVIYPSGFDYITQRPTMDGVPGNVMLGGGFTQSRKQGNDQVGVYDDSTTDALTDAHNLGIMATIFEPRWGRAVDESPNAVWSGIMGVTGDSRPLVGRLEPALTGRKLKMSKTRPDASEWIAAEFCGEGMIWAWLSGTAVALMVLGLEDEELDAAPGRPGGRLHDWFPQELLPTPRRLAEMDLADLI